MILPLLVALQSPEKFQRSLAELTSAVEAERAVVEETDRACSDVVARQEVVGKVGGPMQASPGCGTVP